MRSDVNKKKRKFKLVSRRWACIYFIVTVVFLIVLITSNLLPLNQLAKVVGIVAVITLLTFPVLYFKGFKNSRKKIVIFISTLLMIVYGIGIVYLTGTLNFFSNITDIGSFTEDYYVVVRESSNIERPRDIKGKKVITYECGEKGYQVACDKLSKKYKVEYGKVDKLSRVGRGLVNKKYNIIFVSEAHYTALCESRDNFKKKTKIIYKVKIKHENSYNSKAVRVTKEPFNVYISGLDTTGSIKKVSRSDVNMVATVNPKTNKILLTSIPRDAVVKMKSKDNAPDKLTHTGIYGTDVSVDAVEDILGLDINYYVKVNYSTVTKVVDAIGGVDVESDFTFNTHGMRAKYTFYKGTNHLDGSKALAFSRERKSFLAGDMQRNKNQQIVFEAILKKATKSKTILGKYTKILNSVEDNVETSFSTKEIQKLIKMQLFSMPAWDFERQSIIGTPGSSQCYSMGDLYVSIVEINPDSLAKAKAEIEEVMAEK